MKMLLKMCAFILCVVDVYGTQLPMNVMFDLWAQSIPSPSSPQQLEIDESRNFNEVEQPSAHYTTELDGESDEIDDEQEKSDFSFSF